VPVRPIRVIPLALAAVITGATAVALTVVAAPAGAAPAPTGTTSVSLVSAAGDFVGSGRTFTYSDPATIGLTGTAADLTVSVRTAADSWFLELGAPRGEQFRPARYPAAERASFRTGRAPGLDVSGNGRGCNEVWGSIVVDQIGVEADGTVSMLDATFVQHCDSAGAPALRGAVHYRATPLTYRMRSDVGDFVGRGMDRTYTGATSTFSLSGNASNLQYSVSGLRDTWIALLAAPTGQTLKVGTYATARFAGPGQAGLDVFGDGRGCNASTGSLTITELDLDGAQVTGLAATFVQHCESATPALNGTIRFHAGTFPLPAATAVTAAARNAARGVILRRGTPRTAAVVRR
jgi:hypothetical protein